MQRILAMAGLTLRTAARSRVLGLLACMVLGGIAVLPLVLKSDGSAAGQVRLFLEYTLGLTATLLSVAAAWGGAGALALEVASRQAQLLAVKPVRALEIWLGRWLGLMAMNTLLLALAGAAVYGQLYRTVPAAQRAPALSVRRDILPEGRPAGGLAVAPGGTGSWRFHLPRATRAGEIIFLKFRFVASRPDLRTVLAGLWLAGAADAPPAQFPVAALANQDYTLALALPAGSRQVSAVYCNRETVTPVTVLFPTPESARLQQVESSFAANYLRALLLILARLAFCTALGLTAGAFFSFPVAAFSALALLLLAAANRWLQAALPLALAGQAGTGYDRSARLAVRLLNLALRPLDRFDPLESLGAGLLLPWELVGRAWLVLGLLYAGGLAVMGAWYFGRRELGLPAE